MPMFLHINLVQEKSVTKRTVIKGHRARHITLRATARSSYSIIRKAAVIFYCYMRARFDEYVYFGLLADLLDYIIIRGGGRRWTD